MWTGPGCNLPLHLHALLHDADVYGHGRPAIIANASRDVRRPGGSLPVSEAIAARLYSIPWLKHFRPATIDRYVEAFRKAALQYETLLPGDEGNPEKLGGWSFFSSASR